MVYWPVSPVSAEPSSNLPRIDSTCYREYSQVHSLLLHHTSQREMYNLRTANVSELLVRIFEDIWIFTTDISLTSMLWSCKTPNVIKAGGSSALLIFSVCLELRFDLTQMCMTTNDRNYRNMLSSQPHVLLSDRTSFSASLLRLSW